jgi:hypothetical protein
MKKTGVTLLQYLHYLVLHLFGHACIHGTFYYYYYYLLQLQINIAIYSVDRKLKVTPLFVFLFSNQITQ